MGKYNILFSNKAEKDLDVLSDDDFKRIVEGCRRLEDNPIPDDSRDMKTCIGYA